jgi:hypothetical protein
MVDKSDRGPAVMVEVLVNIDGPEAADTITRLTAERDALRGALEWVAQYTHELEVKRKVRNTLKEISK